jgi:hypothetical protein
MTAIYPLINLLQENIDRIGGTTMFHHPHQFIIILQSHFSFRDWLNIPIPPQAEHTVDAANLSLSSLFQHVHTTAVFDGSFLPITQQMGCSFISHHHHQNTTHINSRGCTPHDDSTSMLAEALSFKDLLSDALSVNSKSIHITADSKALQRIGLGKEMTHVSEYNTPAFCSAVSDITRMLKTFDTVYISYVRSHKKLLLENSVVDLLAGIYCNDSLFSVCETVTSANHNQLLVDIIKKPEPRNCDKIVTIPYFATFPLSTACQLCKCPSHTTASCCFSNIHESFPHLSIFCKNQPTRPSAFIDQISNPSFIDWDHAPASMGGDYFTRFTSICINNLRHPDRYHAAQNAIFMFAKTYRIIKGHISRAKPRRMHDPSALEIFEDPSIRLARDAQIAAEFARNLNYHDAIKTLNRDQPIGPLHPAAAAQLHRLYPDRVEGPVIPHPQPSLAATPLIAK